MKRQPQTGKELREQRPAAEPIAIVGIGCWYPGAQGPRQLWENILSRRREFRRLPNQRLPLDVYHDPDPKTPDKTYGSRAAVIDGFEFDWAGRRFPERTYQGTDIAHWLALEVAISAMEDAGHSRETAPRERSAVLVGNTLTGEHTRSNAMRLRWPFVERALRTSAAAHGLADSDQQALIAAMEELYKSVFPPITDDTLAGGLSNTIAGRICNYFDLHGGGYTVDGACSSSLLAVCNAASQLASGEIDFALAGGVDISLDTFELVGFAKTGALTAGEMKVYDRDASGFLPGEGCGFVALKRLADAHAAGDDIYAVIRGWGISSDGKGGITRPSPQGQARAIRRAYQRAGYGASQLDFVEGHGTGTPVGDKAELEALAMVLAEDEAPARSCGVTSLKSILGHTKAAAGVAALIKATLAVNRRVIPATAGLRRANEVFADAGKSLYPVQFGRKLTDDAVLRAGVSAMGFGGINAHLTLESGKQPLAKIGPATEERALLASTQDSEVFLFGAENLSELRNRAVDLLPAAADLSEGELLDLACHLADQLNGASSQVRAAVVAGSPEQLADGLRQLVEALDISPPRPGSAWSDPRQTVWVGNQTTGCRIGYLLPGQGSQQLYMGRTLVERFDWAQRLTGDADRWVAEASGNAVSKHMFQAIDRAESEDQVALWKNQLAQTEIAQPAICLASILYARHLENLGLRPNIVGGHSLGELSALHLAGAFDEEALFKLAAIRGQAMRAGDEESGAMAALRCSVDQAEALVADAPGYVVVANVNGPQQTVVSGESEAVQFVVQRAKQEGVSATPLPVSRAFHSKMMLDAAQRLANCTDIPQTFFPGSVEVLSSVPSCDLVQEVCLPQHFARQAVSRVDFARLARQMGEQCDLLIEVGPGSVASNLARQNLGNSGVYCLPVASRPEADRDLNVVLAAAYALGVDVNWDPLYERRNVRPFVAPSERLFIDNPCERPLQSSRFDAAEAEASVTATARAPALPAADDTLAVSASSPQEHRDANPPQKTAADDLPTADGEPLDQMLLQLVQRQTGYPIESIPLSSRLLDDLNLDSIKAAEFVAEAAHRAGAADRIDPSLFANASLEEIAEALEAARQAPADGGEPAMATSADESGPGRMPAPSDSHWVRDFATAYEAEDVPLDVATLNGARVAVLADADQQELVEGFQAALQRVGAATEVWDYQTAPPTSSTDDRPVSHWIALLPSGKPTSGRAAHRLRDAASRLHAAATAVKPGSDAHIAFVQFGGDRVDSPNAAVAPESACAAGFAQSLHHEQPRLRIRVVDVHPDLGAADVAQAVIRELSTSGSLATAAYSRHLVRHVPTAQLQQPAAYLSRELTWSSRDVILVTGGAKGVTAECALQIGKQTGAALALVGRSPAPTDDQGEIAKVLERFSREGVSCRYYSCDVVDAGEVHELIDMVHRDLGRVTGVIHGAGMNKPRPVHTVTVDEALAEIAPKVIGAQNLYNALDLQPPKLIVALTSIIGVTGMPGNAWYAFANETLALMTRQFAARRPQTQAVSIAYSVWEEVGMGARLGSVERLAKMGIDAVDVQEGVRRFAQLFAGRPAADQVIVTARLGGLDSWRPSTLPEPEGLRFLEEIDYVQPGVELRAKAHLTLERDLYLADHLYNGSYLFPTVFGLEAMAQAAAYLTGRPDAEFIRIEDVELQRPVVVDPQHGAVIGLYAEASEENAAGETAVRVGIRTERTGMALDHFAATLVIGRQMAGKSENWDTGDLLDINPMRDLYGDLLFQGPRFQRMEGVYSVDDLHCLLHSRAVANDEAATDSFAGGLGRRLLLSDPYFRDLMLQSVQLLIPQHDCLPVSIGCIERYRGDGDLSGPRFVRADLRSRGTKEHVADVTATSEQGVVVARMRNYCVRVLAVRESYPTADELAAPASRDERTLTEAIRSACDQLEVAAPNVALAHSPEIHDASQQERCANSASLATRALRRAGKPQGGKNPQIRVVNLPSGKPELRGENAGSCDLSVSHDQCYHLVVVGNGPQGCDIEPIVERSRAKWTALLGAARSELLDELMGQGDSLDCAATRVWSALEAVRKAHNDADPVFMIRRRDGDQVLLETTTASGPCQVVTVPTLLTRRPERMVALLTATANTVEAPPLELRPLPENLPINEA